MIPFLTADQMREVDRLMVETYRIRLIQMMETAGRQLADLARVRYFGGKPAGRQVLVLAGSGGNGGGGLVAARYLANWGAEVEVLLSRPLNSLEGVPAHQAEILRQLQIPLGTAADREGVEPPDLILDALLGYSVRGEPYGAAADLIRWVSGRGEPVLSLDLPSGLDPDRGVRWDLHIRADATLTLALPKQGLRESGGSEAAGALFLADIGVPPALYRSLGLHVGPIFARQDRIRLDKQAPADP